MTKIGRIRLVASNEKPRPAGMYRYFTTSDVVFPGVCSTPRLVDEEIPAWALGKQTRTTMSTWLARIDGISYENSRNNACVKFILYKYSFCIGFVSRRSLCKEQVERHRKTNNTWVLAPFSLRVVIASDYCQEGDKKIYLQNEHTPFGHRFTYPAVVSILLDKCAAAFITA